MHIDLERIRDIVCQITGISPFEFDKKTRKREVVQARQFYCHFAKFYTKCSLNTIGKSIGKDHATVLYGQRTIRNLYEINDEIIAKYFNKIDKKLKDYFNPKKEFKITESLQNQLDEQIIRSKQLLLDIKVEWVRISEPLPVKFYNV
jgi:hypothetical protein